jgi:RNA polymerase sigma-70 factor (ECF subfamily)
MRSDEPHDVALLRRVQHGDQDAVAALYDMYGAVAYALARRVTNHAESAEDVVQESFVALWRQAPRFDVNRGAVRSWFLSIVHHKAVDAVRRRKARDEAPLPEMLDESIIARDRTDDLAERNLDGEVVRQAMREIPEEQRSVIELAYFGGLTHVEIAEKTGIPVGTVKSRLRLGLEKMRESLRAKVVG